MTPEGIDTHIDHDEDDGGEMIMITAGIIDEHGTNWNATGHVTPPVTDDDIAAMLLKAAGGAAALHGTGVWMALQRRLLEAT